MIREMRVLYAIRASDSLSAQAWYKTVEVQSFRVAAPLFTGGETRQYGMVVGTGGTIL